MAGLTWVHSVEVPWDILGLKQTMLFAAERMMEMLPPSKKCHQDMETETYLMSVTSNSNTSLILHHVSRMYTTSTEIHREAIQSFGPRNNHDWTAVFLEYQGMMSCAQRQLQKEVDKGDQEY